MLPALRLAGAMAMPPHARVNSQCYPVWNEDRSDLRLVWRGATYAHGFHAFGVQPDSCSATCWADGCVQRLWCTDSGMAGWYGRRGDDEDVPLAAAWLRSPRTAYRRVLRVAAPSGPMDRTSAQGPGTLAVAGSTLYFYTFAWAEHRAMVYGLPRLSSLVFAEWRSGASGDELVAEGLRALNVLGYHGNYRWYSWASPLYPSGPGAVTLSVESAYRHYEGRAIWAIDAVVQGARGALVHYLDAACPSVYSASREVATFPDYSCRAFLDGGAQCAAVGAGRYTWERDGQVARSLGMRFAPLEPFALPGALWLHAAESGIPLAFAALVGFGHAPALGVAGDALVGVEARDDAGCASGSRLALVTRALPSGVETTAEALGCEWRVVAWGADESEPAYGALALKWPGPWAEGPLLTAVDMAAGVYHLRGTPETETGDASTEHVAWGGWGTVTLRTPAGLLRCPTCGRGGVPDDAAIAAGAARDDRPDCLAVLVTARVAATAVHGGCPLLAHAGGAAAAMALLRAGAEPNAKCTNGSTPLLQALGAADVVAAMLDAGAAVCTWPQSAGTLRSVWDNQRAGHSRALAAAPTAPCEPGFWLAAGEGCSGLSACPRGSYCPGWHARTNAAAPCPAGTFGTRWPSRSAGPVHPSGRSPRQAPRT